MIQIRSHVGLRGLAALFVVAYHLQYRAGHLPIEDATTFFKRSYLMVDLFFILSGFIMAYVYDLRPGARMTRADVRTFLLRRFIRIYPLHLVTLIAMVLYATVLSIAFAAVGKPVPVQWSDHSLVLLGAQFLLLNAWVPGPNGWNIPSWSISAEFVAYLLFPAFVAVAAARPRPAALLGMLGAILFYIYGADGSSLDITGGAFAPVRCLAGFVLGLVMHGSRSWFGHLGSRTLSVIQIAAVIWSLLLMAVPSNDSLVIPGFACVVVATWTDRGVIAQALSTRVLQWLGDISYAVYIVHILVINVFFGWDRSVRRMIDDPMAERIVFICVCYLLVIAAASLLYVRFEKPVRIALTQRWLARPAQPLRTVER